MARTEPYVRVMSAQTSHAPGWIPSLNSFGARLAVVRQEMGWGNVKEAADACGLPAESWRSWERDGRHPRELLRVAQRVSSTVGCDFYWLVAGSYAPGNGERHPVGCRCDLGARRDSNPQPSDP